MSMIFQMFAISDQAASDLLAAPSKIRKTLASLDKSRSALSLEKSWHGLHYLLTGDPIQGDPPLNFLLAGGSEVGDEDIGYGPARILDAGSVAVIDGALAHFSESDLDARLDPRAMDKAQIYPNIWRDSRDALREEYTEYLQALKQFIHQTAESGQAVLIALR